MSDRKEMEHWGTWLKLDLRLSSTDHLWHMCYRLVACNQHHKLHNLRLQTIIFVIFRWDIRDGPIPVSVLEISAHVSVSAVSVSAIKICCQYADTRISAVRPEAALFNSIGIGNIGISAEVDIGISAYRQKYGIGPSLWDMSGHRHN